MLTGIRVLDFSRIIAGPLCAQYLADLGADVIKVERPATGDDARSYVFPATWNGLSTMFLSFNRGKRSVELDVATESGCAMARTLAASADVLIENFRPGVMDRLSLGYDALAQANPRLVFCSISGFGQNGPLAQVGANDLVAQASCGLMGINATADARPQKVAPAVVDLFTGVNAAFAILAALRQRDATGQGTHITTSLFECGISMLSYFATSSFAEQTAGPQTGVAPEASASITVPNQSFRCSDGWIVVACSNESMWRRLTQAVGRPGLADDARFANNLERTRNKDALIQILDELFLGGSREHWISRLTAAKVSVSAALSVAEALAHPQVASLNLVTAPAHSGIPDFRMLSTPFRFGGARPVSPLPPPELGEHNAAVLSMLAECAANNSAKPSNVDAKDRP